MYEGMCNLLTNILYMRNLTTLNCAVQLGAGVRRGLKAISSKYKEITVIPKPLPLFKPTNLVLDLYPATFLCPLRNNSLQQMETIAKTTTGHNAGITEFWRAQTTDTA